MNKTDEKYQAYVQILKEELVPAMGCTEPIALAYAAAKAREVLGCLPDKVVIEASGSIIKNVKGFSGPFSAVSIKCALGDSGSQLSKRRWLCPCARIVKTTVWRDGCAMRSMRPPCKDRCNSEAQAYRLMPSSCKTNSSSVSICL